MINLDPAIVDQETIRKQRRKKLLTIYAAPVAALLIIAAFFLSTSFFNIIFSIEYGGRSYDLANSFSNTRQFMNVLEPYIAHYDRGVTELQMKQYVKAENSFTEALQNSPREDRLCMIYVNLALSIEYQADQSLAGKNYEQALILYNRAESTLLNNGCAGNNGSKGKDSKADDAKERINDKRSNAINEMNNIAGGDDDTNVTGDNRRRVTDEEVEAIIDKKIPSNHLRGNINYNSLQCNISNQDKCY